ncbi:amino acid ABC transporter permease [Winkia neuii]|uniref:Amino acid ABC transporter permease n=2 Tax=Winkia neuii TaxID=33007 RepID=A0A2I1IKW9_9ACTO|nr:amino acid ABC transporter permease [Winkia neuii]
MDMEELHRNNPQPVFKPGRLIGALVVALIALAVINSLVTNPNYRWDVVGQYLFHPSVMRGIVYTLLLTVGSMVIGIILATTMAIMRQSENPVTRSVAWFYIWFFRGTPIYTQLIFWGLLPTLYQTISLGVPFGPELFSYSTDKVLTPGLCALAGLGLNEGAYLAEIIRSGLNSVDQGPTEAATALGMKPAKIMRRIILPQAMRVIIPPTGNETISMLKTTSLVAAVPFTLELQFAVQELGNRTFMPIPLLLVAVFWYLLITSVLMVGQYYIERYFGRGFDQRDSSSSTSKDPKTAFLDVTP